MSVSPELKYPCIELSEKLRNLVAGRAFHLNNTERYSPFFIIGSGRAGTTLLRRILQTSPEVHIPPETHALGRSINVFLRNRSSSWTELVYRVYSMFEFDPDFEAFEISLRPLVREVISAPEECRTLAYILHNFYTFHGEQTGQEFKRWGDKTPLNTFYLHEILSVFPDAKFVNMIRDGADVIHSYLTAGVQPDLDAAATRWKKAVNAASEFASSNPDQVRDFRYEDLVRDPEKITRCVCKYLHIKFGRELVRDLGSLDSMQDVLVYKHHENLKETVTPNFVGKGRELFSKDERVFLQAKIGVELKALGYEPLI